MKRYIALTGLYSIAALINFGAMSAHLAQSNIGLAAIGALVGLGCAWIGSLNYKKYVETRLPKQ